MRVTAVMSSLPSHARLHFLASVQSLNEGEHQGLKLALRDVATIEHVTDATCGIGHPVQGIAAVGAVEVIIADVRDMLTIGQSLPRFGRRVRHAIDARDDCFKVLQGYLIAHD